MAQVNKQVPREALRLTVPCEFVKSEAGAKTAPVKMLARSGQPIEHWYWGNVIHDMSGMTSKDVIPIDYCHYDQEILGFIDTFDTTAGDLLLSGQLTPFEPTDRASEVLFKTNAGVPYEASINFCGEGILLEEVGRGQVAQVNGYQFEGPGIIVRKWPLRGVAICPYGADGNTNTELKESKDTVSVVYFSKESEMSKTIAAPVAEPTPATALATKETPATAAVTKTPAELAAEAAKLAAATPATPAAPAAGADKPGQAFITAFGDAGARAFLEGKSFEATAAEFIATEKKAHADAVTALNAAHKVETDALSAKVTELTGRLDGLKLGNDAVNFEVGQDKDKVASTATVTPPPSKFASALPDNLAKVAAALKMPGKKE